jgi:peptidoglycan hydrolase-like protein with peptidoglycan-binding domain
VMRLQKKNNLFADGIVGPQTKRTLYSLLDVYRKPTLVSGN